MEWVECQNDECKFRTTGFANGRDRRKRIVQVFLEGASAVIAKCPVCKEPVTWKADPEKTGLLITGDVADIVGGVREMERFVFENPAAKRLMARMVLAADQVTPPPNNEEKGLDKPAKIVLDNLFGKK
jgi:hypothetical protein